MPKPPQTNLVWRLRVTPEMHRALTREQRRRKCTAADLLRSLIAAGLGDDSLAEGRPPGRPRKDDG